jgi:hypothetical protein
VEEQDLPLLAILPVDHTARGGERKIGVSCCLTQQNGSRFPKKRKEPYIPFFATSVDTCIDFIEYPAVGLKRLQRLGHLGQEIGKILSEPIKT